MRSVLHRVDRWAWALLVVGTFLLTPTIYAGNQVMGEIQFEGKSKVERTSGVWVDGGYVGYLKELKGSKKVLLLPGEHVITVRQDGYQDFTERVNVQPGQKQVVRVAMQKAPTGVMPAVKSTVKLEVNPPRAAVFVDGLFVGHVAEFEGVGRGMLVAPGPHKIRVALPGYQTFETDVNALPRQKVEVKTNLLKTNNDAAVTDPLMKPGSNSATPIPPPEPLPKARQKDTTPIPPPDPLPPPQR
ncbi:MAG: PEGA domain-containing protein [Bdellovibrionota bacterium]